MRIMASREQMWDSRLMTDAVCAVLSGAVHRAAKLYTTLYNSILLRLPGPS
jgi:hypothetical protein